MWALGIDGENGVHTYLRNFRADFDLTLALSGHRRIDETGHSAVRAVEKPVF